MIRALAIVALVAGVASAGPLIRAGASAPNPSRWADVDQEIIQTIADAVGANLALSFVSPPGAGADAALLDQLRKGKLDVAELGGPGLEAVDASIVVLELPMMFDSQTEADFVVMKMWPTLTSRFAKQGLFLAANTQMRPEYIFGTKQIAGFDKAQLEAADSIVIDLAKQLGASLVTGNAKFDLVCGTYLDATTQAWKVSHVIASPLRYRVGAIVFATSLPVKLSSTQHRDAARAAAKNGHFVRVGMPRRRSGPTRSARCTRSRISISCCSTATSSVS